MIHPTVGRIVWYYPDHRLEATLPPRHNRPLAAIIAHVWSDTCINIAFFDSNGAFNSATSVLLWQEGNPRPGAGFCEWMPYQIGQAQKAEATAKKYDEATAKLAAFKASQVEPVAETNP
jgi:hypothetical protein